ncbi:PREDICTED: TNF receptor-associated factor 6-like [Acropora digitifera]|uniref:TNF receptor-associated factor 6-like n=1 Tax=Acropora digitifera TaxID=70779 RepID=UPI00077AE9B3|nr:PREDICTED: TNF receptor-associated factor 6-like [Acropora digitifera]XP_015776378.1 PREDICTED: TNF receptor-associated factor 6-like [Acropora digitifera]
MIKRLGQSHDKHINNMEAHIQQQKLENSQLKDTIKHQEQRNEKHVNNLEAHIQQQKLENGQLKDTIKRLEQRLGELDKHVNNLEAHHQRQEMESGILRVSVETYLEALTSRMNPQEHYLSNGFYLWKIENYEQSRQDAISGVKTDKFSPTIYTSRYGYRLRLRICLNGVDSGVGRNIALFVQMVKGDYDDFLEWPVTGKITLSILDQSEGLVFRQHISKTVTATRNLLAFQKPIAGYNSACEGHEEMAPIKDILAPQYIKNNTMLVCVHIEP